MPGEVCQVSCRYSNKWRSYSRKTEGGRIRPPRRWRVNRIKMKYIDFESWATYLVTRRWHDCRRSADPQFYAEAGPHHPRPYLILPRHRLGGGGRIRPSPRIFRKTSSSLIVSTWNLAYLSGHQFDVVSRNKSQNRQEIVCYRSNFVTSLPATWADKRKMFENSPKIIFDTQKGCFCLPP